MKLKDAVYDNGCPTCGCGQKQISSEVYGCDVCKKEINSHFPYDENRDYLEITIFYKSERDSERFQFCSWKCVFSFLKNLQNSTNEDVYFLNLPHVMFDGTRPGYDELMGVLNND
jgi:hypothetical protein